MKVFVNKNLKCCVEIQFESDSHAITPEMARQLVTELEKALDELVVSKTEDYESNRT